MANSIAILKRQPGIPVVLALITLCMALGGTFSCQRHSTVQSTPEQHMVDSLVRNYHPYIDSLKYIYQVYQQQNDLYGMMVAGRELGRRCRETNRFDEALKYHHEGLEAATQLEDTLEIVQAYNLLATTYRRLGFYNEASTFHYQALSLCDEPLHLQDPAYRHQRMSSLNGIGNVYLRLGENELADSIFRKALKGSIDNDNILGQAINYANLGAAFQQRELYDSARIYYGYSLLCNQQVRSELGISLCYYHLGEIYKIQGDYVQAINYHLKSFQGMSNNKDDWHWLKACLSLAEAYIGKGDLSEALKYLSEAEPRALAIKSLERLAETYELFYKLYHKEGNTVKSLYYLQKATSYKDSMELHNSQIETQNARIYYERSRYDKQMETMQRDYDNALRIRNLRLLLVAGGLFVLGTAFFLVKSRRHSEEMHRQYHLAEEARLEAERANHVKDVFLQNITHEIRTPLNSILGFNELLQDPHYSFTDQEREDIMEQLRISVRNLTHLVDDTLSISLLDSFTYDVNLQEVDAKEQCRLALGQAACLCPEGVNLQLQWPVRPEEEVHTLRIDVYLLQKVLAQYLSNACKYTERGAITLSCTRLPGGTVEFAVADTGCGIDSHNAEIVFERFEKLGSYKQGNGLGLSIVRVIARLLHGVAYLDTAYQEGARFVFRLPGDSVA